MNKLLDKVLEALVSKDVIVGYEEDSASGFFFLQLPVYDWFGHPLEMLVDISESNECLKLVGQGACSFSINGPRSGTIAYYAFIAANTLNQQITDTGGMGKWTFEVTAETIDEALQTKGKGGYIFSCVIPSLDAEAMTICIEKGIDTYLTTRGKINRFLNRAAENPDELDADDALLGNKQEVCFHPVLDEFLSRYGAQEDESL